MLLVLDTYLFKCMSMNNFSISLWLQGRIQYFQIEGAQKIMYAQRTSRARAGGRSAKSLNSYGRGLGPNFYLIKGPRGSKL